MAKRHETAETPGSQGTRYVTTAIVYPNSRIHVGWAWECLGADWLARSYRWLGYHTFFSTGMDEHSLNVQKAAEAKSLTPQKYCDQMAHDIRQVLDQLGIQYDRFIRTSDKDHHQVVQALVQKAFDKGDIYRARYEGHYCEGCEAYYTEKDLKNGLCPVHQKEVKWLSEENYFFRLSKYEKQLLKLYESNPDFFVPPHRRSEVLRFIQDGLKDFSVSRSNFTWGIPLPFGSGEVIYVWFDALINYLTSAGILSKLEKPSSPEAKKFDELWPTAIHIIGKDISRFHCVFWPAMLMSLELPLPKKIFAHGFIQVKGERMSKSSGNVVAPDEVVAHCGADPFRYYMLAEMQFSQDGNFSWESLILKNNADLANEWGNLVNRSISMTLKYFPGEALMPAAGLKRSQAIKDSFEKLLPELKQAVEQTDPTAYISACQTRVRMLNLFVDQSKPWQLAKNPSDAADLKEVLSALLEGIRLLATAYLPVLPFGMPKVFEQLGVPVPELAGACQALVWGAQQVQPKTPTPIYPRLEQPVSA